MQQLDTGGCRLCLAVFYTGIRLCRFEQFLPKTLINLLSKKQNRRSCERRFCFLYP
jgi:hypothetical protein